MSKPTPQRQPCVGLLGRLFGHKFKIHLADWVYSVRSCSRCGMPYDG